jgi:ubiquinone/menaquinone biosynthesis C-methylase UbiE
MARHHEHPHGPHGDHDWSSQAYVSEWVARDDARQSERQAILDRMFAAAPFAADASIRILDVGGGAGAVTEAASRAFPQARITLQDFSQPMMDQARERIPDPAGRISYVRADFSDPNWTRSVGGPFDLVVSGIAIHNLYESAAIAACYRAIYGLLKPGGCFLDYDHFGRVGGLDRNIAALREAGFKSVEIVWHEEPTAVVKAIA